MKLPLLAIASSAALLSSTVQAADFDFGVGAGITYSGLGASAKYLSSDSSAFGLSVGCVSLSNVTGNNCGIGVSYERTDLFPSHSNQHAVGIYLGLVDSENVRQNESIVREEIYGASLFYNYYLRGLGERGFHLGGSVTAADENDGTEVKLGLQVGYRF